VNPEPSYPDRLARVQILPAALGMALALSACGAVQVSPSSENSASRPPASSPSASSPGAQPDADCGTEELSGVYRREITSADAQSSDVIGDWTLEIGGCSFEISQGGRVQGGGRIELVEGTAASGRVALSEDVCPNEFTGAAFYNITLEDQRLAFAEAIMGTDQCEGRAEAFVTPPVWERVER
jgi:hypothetical protein